MALGQFGSLIQGSKAPVLEKYTAFSGERGLTFAYFLGKPTFAKNVTNPIENQPALENLAEDGGLNVKS